MQQFSVFKDNGKNSLLGPDVKDTTNSSGKALCKLKESQAEKGPLLLYFKFVAPTILWRKPQIILHS